MISWSQVEKEGSFRKAARSTRRAGQLSILKKRVVEALAGQAKPDPVWLELLGDADWGRFTDEVSDRTGFRRFDYDRYASVAAWFCRRLRQVSRTVINKLFFYSDFLNFRTATVSITGTSYPTSCRWPKASPAAMYR